MARSILVLLAIWVSWTLSASAAPRPRPALVLVGGGLDDPRIVDEIVRLGGGPGRARVGVITAASGDPIDGAKYYRKLFKAHGVDRVCWLPIDVDHKDRAGSARIARHAEKMSVFFIGGGDQSRLTECFLDRDGNDTPVLAAIRRAYQRGAVVAGTSAGAAGQACRIMITGGTSEAARRRGATEGQSRGDELTFRRGGLGFFPFGIPDTHFSQRGRQDRLVRLAADTKTRFGFGIDEDTALIVENPLGREPSMRALGKGKVTVYDLARARPASGSRWPLCDLGTTRLSDGDSYKLPR